MPLSTKLIPATVVLAEILGNVLWLRMERKVRTDKSDVMKERFVSVFLMMFLKALDCVIGNSGCRIVVTFVTQIFDWLVVDSVVFCGEEVALVPHV